jgi:hypothetical protein
LANGFLLGNQIHYPNIFIEQADMDDLCLCPRPNGNLWGNPDSLRRLPCLHYDKEKLFHGI